MFKEIINVFLNVPEDEVIPCRPEWIVINFFIGPDMIKQPGSGPLRVPTGLVKPSLDVFTEYMVDI